MSVVPEELEAEVEWLTAEVLNAEDERAAMRRELVWLRRETAILVVMVLASASATAFVAVLL